MPHVHNALHHFTRQQSAYKAIVGEESGGFTGLERAGETLTPILNLWERAEYAFLRGELLYSAFHSQGATAAESSFVGLRNPAGSGLIAVVEQVQLFAGTATSWTVRQGVIVATDVDGSEDLAPRDTRAPLTGVGPLVKIHGAGVAQIGNDALESVRSAASTDRLVDTVRVLTPGFELRFYSDTVNLAINVGIRGYMRPAQEGEL